MEEDELHDRSTEARPNLLLPGRHRQDREPMLPNACCCQLQRVQQGISQKRSAEGAKIRPAPIRVQQPRLPAER